MYKRNKLRGIHHVCLRVPDLHRTAKFYIDALGAEVVAEWGAEGQEDHAFILDLGTGDYLEIFGSKQKFDIGSWQHVAVWTDDIEASYQRALDCGASEHARPKTSHIPTRSGQVVHMKYAFVRAPGGEMVEFIEDAEEQ